MALLLLSAGYSQVAPSPETTIGFTNGRLWLKMDDVTKLSFLVGARDAFFLGGLHVADHPSKLPELLKYPHLETKEIAKELDLFYSEGANAPIPIMYAIRYVRHKAIGDTQEELQFLMASLRRDAQPKPKQ